MIPCIKTLNIRKPFQIYKLSLQILSIVEEHLGYLQSDFSRNSGHQIRTTTSEGVGKWQQLQQCEVTVGTDAGWNRMCWKVSYLQMWRVLSAGVDMAEKLSLCFYEPVSQLVVKIVCLSAYHCSVDEAVHFRKVGRFPAISAHLWKVEFRRCTHGTPSGLLWLGFTLFYRLVHLRKVGRYRG